MASSMTPPSNGELWHLSIDDLLGPVPETFRLGGPGPFVINLRSSSTSMSPLPNFLPGFEKFHLFQVQRIEDDVLRFRMRLGLFASEDEADAALLRVRDNYPCALTATAAADDLQAIELLPKPRTPVVRAAAPVVTPVAAPDETSVAAPVASPVEPPVASLAAALPAPEAAPFELFPAEPVALPVKQPAAPRMPTLKQRATPEAITVGLLASAPFQAAIPAASALSAPPARLTLPVAAAKQAVVPQAPVVATPSPAVLTSAPAAPRAAQAPIPMVVKGMIAQPTAAPPAPAKVTAMNSIPAQSPMRGTRRETDLESTQTVRRLTPAELSAQLRWFVIELSLTEHAIDPETVPNLDIFGLYRLYSVAEIDEGRRMHALRLGFFSEEIAAKAVASYLEAYYDKATVKRVSVGERERFSEQGIEARKDVGATGMHATIEITADRHARPVRKPVTPPP